MSFDRRLLLGAAGIACGWFGTVEAAERLPDSLVALPWAQVGLGSLLAMWGGLTHTLQRSVVAKRTGAPFSMALELRMDVSVSAFVGFLTFMFGGLQGWSVYGTALSVAFMGWMGTRALALAEKRFTAWVNNDLGQRKP